MKGVAIGEATESGRPRKKDRGQVNLVERLGGQQWPGMTERERERGLSGRDWSCQGHGVDVVILVDGQMSCRYVVRQA